MERHGYTCGTLFVDHASGKVFNCLQLSTTAAATIDSKHALERLAFDDGITIKSYHSDNGIFASDAFCTECQKNSQKLTFSGVGAHHQNGIAERNIKTISHWARTNMLHAAFHWPEHASIKLWPQAVDYAVWVFNRLPSIKNGLSPNELWSSTRSSNHDLCRAHPFGCPVFVLDPALQDGGKIPKWDARARRGMFVGFSHRHSSPVPLCLNLRTGKISPQFHVVFDEKFHTVTSIPKGISLHDQWSSILQFDHDCFCDIDNDLTTDGGPPLPQDFVDWFDNPEHIGAAPIDPITADETPAIQLDAPNPYVHDHDTDPDKITNPEGDNESEGGALAPEGHNESEGDAFERPSRNMKSWKDGPANIRKFPIDGEEYDFTFTAQNILDPAVPLITSRGLVKPPQQPLQRITKSFLHDSVLMQRAWTQSTAQHTYFLMDVDSPTHVDIISDPRVLEAYAGKSKYNDDNPSFDMAVNRPFQAEYWEAMRTELNTISHDFKCWLLVPRTPEMNVLPSTWAFKIKRFPDGSVKKFKARFCACGDKQLEGVDYFETWAPVVQWSTIRIIMIVAAKLCWCTAQCDITAAFNHAYLPSTEQVYVEQPRGFHKKSNHVLRLNRSLYGLKQAPRHFFSYLSERLWKMVYNSQNMILACS
jgi:hypothetical protein